MVYILNDQQKAKKAEQNSKRYYELKEIKLKNKAIALERKNQKELARKELIKKNRIYNFVHMRKYRDRLEAPKINDFILLNDLIHHDSDSDEDEEPIILKQMKFKFV